MRSFSSSPDEANGTPASSARDAIGCSDPPGSAHATAETPPGSGLSPCHSSTSAREPIAATTASACCLRRSTTSTRSIPAVSVSWRAARAPTAPAPTSSTVVVTAPRSTEVGAFELPPATARGRYPALAPQPHEAAGEDRDAEDDETSPQRSHGPECTDPAPGRPGRALARRDLTRTRSGRRIVTASEAPGVDRPSSWSWAAVPAVSWSSSASAGSWSASAGLSSASAHSWSAAAGARSAAARRSDRLAVTRARRSLLLSRGDDAPSAWREHPWLRWSARPPDAAPAPPPRAWCSLASASSWSSSSRRASRALRSTPRGLRNRSARLPGRSARPR